MKQEDGVATAIQCIYRDLEYAKSLIKRKDGKPEETAEEPEESWTFIGDDGDPELIRRIHYDMGKDSASASTSTGGPGRGTEMPVRGTKI
jgi:sterol 3beta-glucosyltransferase